MNDMHQMTAPGTALADLMAKLDDFLQTTAGPRNVNVVAQDDNMTIWGVEYGDTGFSVVLNITP